MADKNIPEYVLTSFSKSWNASSPEYFAGGYEWSDGTLFKVQIAGQSHVLKILPGGNEHTCATVHERMAFAGYTAEQGVQTTKPILSRNQRIVEKVLHVDKEYLAVCWKYIPGKALGNDHPSDLGEFYGAWGRLLGKLHRLAQGYPTWQESETKDTRGAALISRKAEWDVFYNWLQDDDVKDAWRGMGQSLENYPIKRDNFGWVHNDAHPGNLLQNEMGLVLLDFDVANCLWFALDLAICINSEYARILHHSTHKKDADKLQSLFLQPFMQGYAEENTLDTAELRNVGRFIHYRHFLMFAVFYNQIKENAPQYLEIMKNELLSGESYIRRQTEEFFA